MSEAHEVIDVSTHEFSAPVKVIKQVSDVTDIWEKSEAYQDLLGCLCAMNEACKNTKLRDDCHISTTTANLIKLLNTLDGWVDEIPPVDQPQRFGNKAFRDWFSKLQENSESLVREAVDESLHKAVPEIAVYLVESVGNSTRIDYGTGHELSFVAFLCCLYKLGALKQEDAVATVCKIFQRYMQLMRKVQSVYRLEPAGSHGVWCLDDYHFVPFIWGSSQLMDHPRIKPKSFPDVDICEAYAKDYIFLSAIDHIHKVKTGPFAEHSNQLWNISGVMLWSKVNSGLIKMYKAEVLAKFPVIQHFMFGSLLTDKPATPLSR